MRGALGRFMTHLCLVSAAVLAGTVVVVVVVAGVVVSVGVVGMVVVLALL